MPYFAPARTWHNHEVTAGRSRWNRGIMGTPLLLVAVLGACDLPAALGLGFSVDIGRDELEMVVGDTVRLDANVRNAEGGSIYFRWISSRPEVARTEGSRLIAVSPGTAVVTVTAFTLEDGDTDHMTVRVRP
ncbi:MAG TPA: hypothetical protein VF192_10760 [Longimicrobiales bacterium]